MIFTKLLLVFCVFISSAFSYESADVRFEVEKGLGKRLTLKAFERSSLLFSQTVDPTFNAALIFGQNVLSRHGNGYKILYNGRDKTSLSLEVDQDGNISLAGADEQTGFEKRKSWGFKTFGTIRHQGSSLFYNLLTHAQQFHNFGILKSYTGEFLQNYLFNRGIIHFGDETAFVHPDVYLPYFQKIDHASQPVYENGVIDDRGVILAERGLMISNLTHRARGVVDIGGQGLDLQNAGIDNHGAMNVVGPVRGHLHHFSNHNSFYADSMQRSNLRIDHWSNSGLVYLSQSSELFSQESWNNTGSILTRGNSLVGCRKKPTALGAVISEGEIKVIIEEALDNAALKEVFDKAALISRKKKIVHHVFRHTDHYLNTKVNHHVNGRYTHSTETGYVFQRRTTEKTQKEVEVEEGGGFPEAAIKAQQSAQRERNFFNTFKTNLKEKLKQLGLLHTSQKGIMAALLKRLGEAGLSNEDIEEIFDEGGIADNLFDMSSLYESHYSREGRQSLQSDFPDVGSFLSGISSQAQRAGLPIWQWAQRNGPEFVEGFCNLAILASRYTPHPVVAVPARVCTLGQLAPRAVQKLEQAHAFFSKKYEGGGKVSGSEGIGYSQKPNLTAKQKEQLQGVPLRGQNPGNVFSDKSNRVRVDTERLGGGKAARRMFEELSGKKLPSNAPEATSISPNGGVLLFRAKGDSGHPKLEITEPILGQLKIKLEKITFL